jgi:hypothetical protein
MALDPDLFGSLAFAFIVAMILGWYIAKGQWDQ